MNRIRQIGIFLDLVGAHGRGIFVGIRRYAEEVGNWHCRIPPATPVGILTDLSKWDVDGWIAFGRDNQLGTVIQKRPAPVVWVSTFEGLEGPGVVPNHEAIGRMAFDYLLERGHTNFGYVGFDISFSHLRQNGFRSAVEEFGRPCHIFDRYNHDERSDDALCAWLKALPRPIGILTCEDQMGSIVLDCCRTLGYSVPEDVAVLGVDNDELRCTVRIPTLSSIQTDGSRIGYEAAGTLDRILNGEPMPKRSLMVPPINVVTRQSTDGLAFADEDVRSAVQYIRARVSQPTKVSEVVAHTGLSAQTLDLRFRRQLKSPMLRYIQKLHVEHAIALLSLSERSIAQVARQSGFRSSTRMAIVFRKITGKTPSEFRRQAARR